MPSTAANRGCDSTSPFHLVASSRRKVLPLSLASGKRVSTTLALMVLLSLTVGMCLSRQGLHSFPRGLWPSSSRGSSFSYVPVSLLQVFDLYPSPFHP